MSRQHGMAIGVGQKWSFILLSHLWTPWILPGIGYPLSLIPSLILIIVIYRFSLLVDNQGGKKLELDQILSFLLLWSFCRSRNNFFSGLACRRLKNILINDGTLLSYQHWVFVVILPWGWWIKARLDKISCGCISTHSRIRHECLLPGRWWTSKASANKNAIGVFAF